MGDTFHLETDYKSHQEHEKQRDEEAYWWDFGSLPAHGARQLLLDTTQYT